MSILRLQLQGHESIVDASIAVEIINTDLETVAELSLSGHEQQAIEVAAGKYLIRAYLPSGQTIKVKTSVAVGEEKQVVLQPPAAAAPPWLKWQHFLGNAYPSQTLPLSTFRSIWLRLWTYHQSTWTIDPLPLHESGRDNAVINYHLNVEEVAARQVRLLQVGGIQVPWRFVALPPSPKLEILIRSTQNGSELDDRLTVAIVSHNWNAETLLKYLAAGNLESAKIVSADVANAEALLAEKLTNPMGAVIAGYYLLRVGAAERLQPWAAHFASQFNWLPDALIIHAWQLLQQSQPNLDLAEQRLLQAAAQGIPLYSRGLRLLFDGLQLFQKHPVSRQSVNQARLDRSIAASLKTIQPYAAAIDWTQPLTAFHGDTPDHPLLSAPIGVPKNQTGLVWLPAPEGTVV